MPADLAAFFAVAAVVIVTPGQDTVLTVRNTLAGGRRGGVATALGVISGQATWALATSLGLAGLLLTSEPAFAALKAVGATYLVYLGARALLSAARRRAPAAGAAGGAARLSLRGAYHQGIVSNLGNPKVAVFFTSLLPQFVASGRASFLVLFTLGLIFAAMTLIWLVAYAVVVARAGNILRRPSIRRLLDGATGVVLIGLGLRLVTERR